MTPKAAAAAPTSTASKPAGAKPAGSKPAGSKPAGSKPAGSKPAGSEPAAPKSAAPKPARSTRRDSDPMAWLAADDAALAEHARWLASAKGRPTRDRLLQNGRAGEFAARLLS